MSPNANWFCPDCGWFPVPEEWKGKLPQHYVEHTCKAVQKSHDQSAVDDKKDKPYSMSPTGLFVTIGVIAAGIFDLAMVTIKGTGSSVSDFLKRASDKRPLIIAGFSFVAGHLWGVMTPEGTSRPDNIWITICAVIFGFGVGWCAHLLYTDRKRPTI